jgi:hypothetical protein
MMMDPNNKNLLGTVQGVKTVGKVERRVENLHCIAHHTQMADFEPVRQDCHRLQLGCLQSISHMASTRCLYCRNQTHLIKVFALADIMKQLDRSAGNGQHLQVVILTCTRQKV